MTLWWQCFVFVRTALNRLFKRLESEWYSYRFSLRRSPVSPFTSSRPYWIEFTKQNCSLPLLNLILSLWENTFPVIVDSVERYDSRSFTEYDPMACLHYKLSSSYDRMTVVGPVAPLRANEEGCSQWEEAQPVDPSRLLIKAWEDKVFPVIRRRFRSQTDRQSGLEQIRGALLAGKRSLELGLDG